MCTKDNFFYIDFILNALAVELVASSFRSKINYRKHIDEYRKDRWKSVALVVIFYLRLRYQIKLNAINIIQVMCRACECDI